MQAAAAFFVAACLWLWEWLCGGVAVVGAKGMDGVGLVGDTLGTGASLVAETATTGVQGLGGILFKGLGSLYDLLGKKRSCP